MTNQKGPGARRVQDSSRVLGTLLRIPTAFLTSLSRDMFLLLLPGAALIMGIFWAAIIPLWQIPDEPAHYGYVQGLGEGRAMIPLYRFSRELGVTYELTGLDDVPFNPSATQDFVPGVLWGPAEREILSLPATLRNEFDADSYNTATAYPPGYYFLASLVYRVLDSRDILTIMFGLRIFSAILTSMTVFFNYLTFRLFFEDRARARAAAFLIVLSPMYIYMGMAVNVDVLMSLLFSIFLFLVTKTLRHGLSWRMNAALAAVVGIGLWVKQTFLIGVPFYVLLLLFMRFRRSVSWSRVVRLATVFASVVLVMDGWLYLSGLIATSPVTSARGSSLGGFLGHFVANWNLYRWAFQETFWGSFGWLDTPLSGTLYAVLGLVSLCGFLGFLFYMRSARKRGEPGTVAFYFLLVVVLFGAALSVVNYSVIASGAGWFLQGRYLFPVMAPLFAILLTGLTGFASKKVQQVIMVAAVVAMVLFHAVVVLNYVVPRYYL